MKNFSTDQGCVVCAMNFEGHSCLHHIYTRGARPDLQYSDFNLIPVCKRDHSLWHNKGTKYMAETFLEVKLWLESNGWSIDEYTGKWYHPKAQFQEK